MEELVQRATSAHQENVVVSNVLLQKLSGNSDLTKLLTLSTVVQTHFSTLLPHRNIKLNSRSPSILLQIKKPAIKEDD